MDTSKLPDIHFLKINVPGYDPNLGDLPPKFCECSKYYIIDIFSQTEIIKPFYMEQRENFPLNAFIQHNNLQHIGICYQYCPSNLSTRF